MQTDRFGKLWAGAAVFLVVAAITGGVLIRARHVPETLLAISTVPQSSWSGNVSVSGAVSRPGIYPAGPADTIGSLVEAAGGSTNGENHGIIELYVSGPGEDAGHQKVDINRADAWLLQALPGIGETLANRIVEYRLKNGGFRNTGELGRVSGIGASTLERISGLITVESR